MKKHVIALAVLSGIASVASAQTTNVTIYGLVDAGIVNERGGPGGNVTKLTSGVQNGSRLGFKGAEDLGGGLSAKFLLESGFNADNGTSSQGGLLFGRQAYVGLGGTSWGNILLGRQYSPHYLAVVDADPFGAGLAGTATNLMSTTVRMNNTIKYTSPDWSGLSGEVAYGFGEVPGDRSGNQQVGAAIGYVKGPLTIRLAHHHFSPQTSDDSVKNTFLMGKWNFGMAALSLGFNRNKGIDLVDNNDILAGVSIPFGVGTILASYIRKNDKSPANADAHQWAIGYTHAMSKRTNLYTSFAHMSNKNGSAFTVGNASDPGTGDKAFNIGVRHLF